MRNMAVSSTDARFGSTTGDDLEDNNVNDNQNGVGGDGGNANNNNNNNTTDDDRPMMDMRDTTINIVTTTAANEVVSEMETTSRGGRVPQGSPSFSTQISALTDREDDNSSSYRPPTSSTPSPPNQPGHVWMGAAAVDQQQQQSESTTKNVSIPSIPNIQQNGVNNAGTAGAADVVESQRSPHSSTTNAALTTAASGGGDDRTTKTSATGTKSVTFGGQTELPPLPVPPLEETLQRFLQCLQALHEYDEQSEEAKRVVLQFLQDETSSNGGPNLQRLLMEYDRTGRASGEIGSYVEEFWNDAYLAPDSSVVLNLNPYFLVEDSPDPKLSKSKLSTSTNDTTTTNNNNNNRQLCIRRAANLCFASVKLASQLRKEDFKPDTLKNGKPLCMDQFRALFAASRIPHRHSKDTIAVYDQSNHVAVMCCKQLYYFQALWPDGDVAVDEDDLFDILHAISNHAHKKDKYDASQEAVGVLTSLPRNEWATAREELIGHNPQNGESLQIIDSALFVLVLDDYIPPTQHDAAANMLHGSYELSQIPGEYTEYQSGTCTNRWYDKLQIIVCGDGKTGINFEHSAIDGHTALRFVSDIYADTVISFAQSITKLVSAHETIPNVINATVKRAATALDNQGRATLDVFPKKITLDLPDSVRRKIYFAETALGDQIVASETYVLEFKDYGKNFITGNKLSPDSYVQMSMMLAYYKLYGRVVCAYEPVLTKSYYHGRTEAMRPATLEAKHLCEVFCNPKSSNDEKAAALRNATRVHSQLVKECARGKGVDRHLFALKCIAEKHGIPVPEFFRSEPWRMLNHTVLSTSNCGNPSLALFGFGPVVPDGLGIGYIIKSDGLSYSISSKHRQTTRYALTLEAVLREMALLFQPVRQTHVRDTIPLPSKRATLKSIPVNDIAYDSYGDIWGENDPGTPVRPKSIISPPVLRKESSAVPNLRIPDATEIDRLGIEVVDKSPTLVRALPSVPDVEPDIPAGKERRWSAEIDITAKDKAAIYEAADAYLESEKGSTDSVDGNVVIIPMKGIDEEDDNDNPTKTKIKFKRRGSNDFMPKRPNRRGSAYGSSSTLPSNGSDNNDNVHSLRPRSALVGPAKRQSSFEYSELSKKGDAIELDDDADRD